MYLLLSKKIKKSIMSPMISNSKNKDSQISLNKDFYKEKNNLLRLRKYIEKKF